MISCDASPLSLPPAMPAPATTRSNVSAASNNGSNNKENGMMPDSGLWANSMFFFTSFVFFYILTNDFLRCQPKQPQ